MAFLHGLAASGRYWHPVADCLEASGRRLYLLDLLGFGRSSWPKVSYTLDDHLCALDEWREAAGLNGEPLVLVGHSIGALVALGWATQASAIASVMLVGFPVFHHPAEARQRLARLSRIHRLTFAPSPLGQLACELLCLTRPLWWLVAPLLAPDVPDEVARDGVLHTRRSFYGTLEHCVFGIKLDRLVRSRVAPTLFIHGTADQTAPVQSVQTVAARLPQARLLEIRDGRHDLPLSHPGRTAEAIDTMIQEQHAV